MFDNSILSVGTIKILKDFNITTIEELKTAILPKVGNKSHLYAVNSFKKRHLTEINEYLTKLKFEPYFGKQIRVTFERFTGESFYNVIGFDANNDILIQTIKGALTKRNKPFSVDKLWFDTELTGRNIEILNNPIEGETYKAIGNCGTTKDIEVEGVLSIEDDLYLLTNTYKRVFSVNPKTLKLI
jgi:hypothetical protein